MCGYESHHSRAVKKIQGRSTWYLYHLIFQTALTAKKKKTTKTKKNKNKKKEMMNNFMTLQIKLRMTFVKKQRQKSKEQNNLDDGLPYTKIQLSFRKVDWK